MVARKFLDTAGGGVPDEPAGGNHRMQCADQERNARQLEVGTDEPFADLAYELANSPGVATLIGEPFLDSAGNRRCRHHDRG